MRSRGYHAPGRLKHPWHTLEVGTPYLPGGVYDAHTARVIAYLGRKWAKRHGKNWVIKAKKTVRDGYACIMILRTQ